MTSFYETYLTELCELQFNKALYEDGVKVLELAAKAQKIEDLLAQVAVLTPIFVDSPLEKLVDSARLNLQTQHANIITFYDDWLRREKMLGSARAYENPDVIVILGGTPHALKIRTEYALGYLAKFPNAVAVLSGGGFNMTRTESDAMLAYLQGQGISNRIIQEKDSMDTLGNAIFTKVRLRQEGVLQHIQNVLIVTSKFHIPRAIRYFTAIFNTRERFNIAASGVLTINEDDRKHIVANELASAAQAEETMSFFEKHPHNPLDDNAVLIQLFQRHAMYKNRYDILRKYLSL